MKAYYDIMTDIHKAAKQGNAPLGEITQIMEDIGEWAKTASQRIMATKFFHPHDEENAISALGDALLGMFDTFGTDPLQIENGTSFRFGTVFNSEEQPVFTIYGAEFYTENGERYDRISKIPTGEIVCYWYNNAPRGWFMKLTNHKTGKPFISEIE